MNRTDAPAKQPKPFGVNGQRDAILPTTPSGDNAASYESGFPPVTMILKTAGGKPPKGQNMNQILFELSSLARWASTGALNAYDSSFATAISGYPKGSVLISNDASKIYINTVDGNATNPNSGGSGWADIFSYIGAQYFGIKGIASFTTPGVTSWTVPDELKSGRKAWVIVIGGGASGSIGSVTAGGSGGAAGGESRKLVDLTGVSSVTVTVGAGGASVTTASTNGNAGSASSFGSYCSATGAPQSNVSSGQIGGVGAGGDINLRGAPSQPGILCSYVSNTQDRAGGTGGGEGGGAAQNGSAQFNSTAELQRDGASPGSGGAGVAPYSGGATTYRSGAGAPGAVYIIW